MSLRFQLPKIEQREDWGPASSSIPPKFQEISYYSPFSKSEMVGKAADWQSFAQGKMRHGQKDANADEESGFQFVDNTKTKSKQFVAAKRYTKGIQQQGKQPQQQRNQWQQTGGKGKSVILQKKYTTKKTGMFNLKKKEPSVQVKPDWTLVEELEFNQLAKLSGVAEPSGEDLDTYGSAEFYNPQYDKLTEKKRDYKLEKTNRVFYNVTTCDDPIIRDLASQGEGDVFATDAILSHLMVCTRSVLPWDIIITKVNNKIFLDKRDGTAFDLLTVNETAPEQPALDDSINGLASLMQEASSVNEQFSQQILNKGEVHKFDNPSPFQSEGESAPVGYRYRKWNLDGVNLVARCEVDAVARGKDSSILNLTVRALNEYDPKVTGDWRKKIDTQRTAVFSNELKNNYNKISKWGAQALLAATDGIKLGYVSRISSNDNNAFHVLAVQDYKPKEFAQLISLNTKNMWSILKKIIDVVMKQESSGKAKYVLMKESEKANLRLYEVPYNSFETSGVDEATKSEATDD